ncbi:MAG: carbohydrate binding family 9 domain-containing protein [Candidatus Aminicenantes bacterium]|nr:carbohydrate binding family 9 domain-containing protein [Candidatus Aminicenantes bacterium]
MNAWKIQNQKKVIIRDKIKETLILTGLSLIFLISPFSGLPQIFSQERTKILYITRVDNPPKIDGYIDDPCWQAIQSVSGFIQYNPINGAPASEETYVWAVYDDNYIYFAFKLMDSQPERIWAELTPRNEFENNDSITIILDTYNDKRTSISFTVNPKGVQKNSVETIWKSEARLQPYGWSAEIAIPFKSLRSSPAESQVWGVNFMRYIHRLNETDYWTDVKRDRPLLQQMGEIVGLEGVKPGHNLEFFPYGGIRSTRWDGERDDKVAFGLDVKYGLLTNLYLDMTVSPDFSEVESDPFIYQLSPYERYFRENRPFFTEGRTYFRLATERGFFWRTDASLFYSRRINNPKFAAKITGKSAGYSFGLLGALNDEENRPDRTFSVVRVQKDVFQNSQIGIYYTGMEEPGQYNRNFAVDYSFNFWDFYYIRGATAFSFNHDREKNNNGLYLFQFQREPDAGLQLSFDFQRIEKNVKFRTGFLTQTDIQSSELMVGYAWRYNRGHLQRISFDLTAQILQDTHGQTVGNSYDFMFFTDFFNRIDAHGGISLGRNRYQIMGDNKRSELVWTRDFIQTYGGHFDFGWERGGFLKEISIEGRWQRQGIYNEEFTAVEPGYEMSIETSLAFRPLSNFELSFNADWIRQTLEKTKVKVFDGISYGTSLHFQITRHLFLTTRLLGETREAQYNFDFLLGYYFGAGNVIQLCYKRSSRREEFGREGGHSLTLKVSYLFRL